MTIVKGRIVTPARVVHGGVMFEDGTIVEVLESADGPGIEFNFGDALIVPGFIDVHMHGLGEFQVREVAELLEVARMEPRFGTTGFLPTAGSVPPGTHIVLGQNVRKAWELGSAGTARVLGAHFEGPFLNPRNKGGIVCQVRDSSRVSTTCSTDGRTPLEAALLVLSLTETSLEAS